MLLDRIDIDNHGPLNQVELGPFAAHLNLICSPEGSGKTAIARFIRDSLVDREYPIGMLSSSSGRIVWADEHGKVHCRREQDGTRSGRRTVTYESRGDVSPHYGQLRHSWIANVTGNHNGHSDHQSNQTLNLPESIVDGVITDSAVTSVARVVSACVRSGLDDPRAYDSLPTSSDQAVAYRAGSDSYRRDQLDRGQLRAELADIEAELARLSHGDLDRERLTARRNDLVNKLSQARAAATPTPVSPQASARVEELYDLSRQLRLQETELMRWISQLDSDLAQR